MRKPSATQLRLAAALGVALLILAYSATNTRRPAPVQTEKTEKRATPRAKPEKASVLRAAAPADANFQRYEMIASRNIFSAPKPPEPKPAADSGKLPPITPVKPESPRPPQTTVAKPPSGPPALTGWSYVGCVSFGGKKLGIMQSDSANTTQDVEVGAQFQGYKVESIEGDEIVLAAGGSRQVLKRPADFQVVPLGGSVAEARPRGQP
jgi:hypothetical protein